MTGGPTFGGEVGARCNVAVLGNCSVGSAARVGPGGQCLSMLLVFVSWRGLHNVKGYATKNLQIFRLAFMWTTLRPHTWLDEFFWTFIYITDQVINYAKYNLSTLSSKNYKTAM
jgi:hypothetical protein